MARFLNLAVTSVCLGLALAEPACADDLANAYNRGMAELRANNHQAALPYFEQALARARERFGPNHPQIAVELNNLGEVYRLLGEFDSAERLLSEAVALDSASDRRNLGATATSLNNLALIAREKGEYAEALKLYGQSRELLEQAYGVNHPDVAKNLNNVAMLYAERGEPEKAEPLAVRAARIIRAELGAQHPTAQVIQTNLNAIRLARQSLIEPAAGLDAGRIVDVDAATTVAGSRPSPRPATESPLAARPASSRTGGFAIHLASVRSSELAVTEWQRFQRVHPELRDLKQILPEKVRVAGQGEFFRVAAGSFDDRDAAIKFCSLFKQKGQYCRVLTQK